MKKRILALMMIGTLLAGALVGCSSNDTAKKTSGSTDQTSESKDNKDVKMTDITLNEVAHSIFYAPMYVAIEENYFADEGINLTLVTGFGVH